MAIILRTRDIEGLWAASPIGPYVPPHARTPDALRERQAAYLALNPAAGRPFIASRGMEAYIGGGVWRVKCPCGERTHADPDWKLACCFGCGRIHADLVFPEDRERIEKLLVLRPTIAERNWAQPETYEDLVAEQIAHGDPIEAVA